MRANGLQLVVDLAVGAVADPRAALHRDALVLGSLRENIRLVPALGVLDEHLSLSHFCGPRLPGGFLPFVTSSAPGRGSTLFGRALAHKRDGRLAAGFVQLGRVAHLVADMACPVHAHRVAHWTDPFEWWVDAHCEELSRLPVTPVDAAPPFELISSLARRTRRLKPDRTNNAPGWVLRRLGLLRPPRREQLQADAHAIIPAAAGTLAALLRMFLEDS